MKTIFFLFVVCSTSLLFGQSAQKVIIKDTINLRGYVFDNLGKPVRYIYIESTQLDPEYNYFKAHSYTDTSGFFNIKGSVFNDTLRFTQGHVLYYTPEFYNKDSRYVIIYLSTKVIDINSSNPVKIEARRKLPKILPKLNIIPFEGGGDFFEIHLPAEYPGGITLFENYLRENIKYPESAIKNNAEGTVQIGFTIEKDGSLINLKILKGVGYGCDEEALKVIKLCRKWRPAVDNGRPYAMKETVSIKFSLTE